MNGRFSLVVVLCGTVVGAAQKPAGPFSTVVEIGPTDKPMQMAALEALLATDARDRLTCGRPATMSEKDYLAALVGGKRDRLKGFWPFEPPRGRPANFTKADYLKAIREFRVDLMAYYEQRYGKGDQALKADANAWEAVPVCVALYKGTGQGKYIAMAERAMKVMCLATDAERAKHPTQPPLYNRYWRWPLAYLYLALDALGDDPAADRMRAVLGKSSGDLANAWPVAKFNGAYNMAFMAAFWYDLSLKYHPGLSRRAELKAYADHIWQLWWDAKDCDEEDPHYTAGDLILLHAWCRLRGRVWWTDPERSLLFRQYIEQVSNDGTWPAYGDGGAPGYYLHGVWLGELMAGLVRDGRYKWLAHRAFWNARHRLWKLCANSGYMPIVWLSLGYCFADDGVREVAPQAGVMLTRRHWVDLTPPKTRLSGGPWFHVRKKLAPRKLVFRSGPKETDHCMLVQAGQLGGHGHMDSGAVQFYGGDHAYFFDYPTLRLDQAMESHNSFALQNPDKPGSWPGRYGGLYTTEDCRVPVMGTATDASYARVHIREYPGTTTAEQSWKTVRQWKKTWTLERAIGYRNWPMRLDRSILFVHNRFTVVRDVARFVVAARARMGSNWTFGQLGSAGTHWVNVWMPKVLYAYGTVIRPIQTAPRDLLIWSAPRAHATLQVEKLHRPRKEIAPYYVPGNSLMNLPMRAWYTRTGNWQPGQAQASTTVLLPHAPSVDAATLADTICVVRDTPEATVLRMTDGDTTRVVVLGCSGKPVTVGALVTDAEAALVTYVKGKPSHVSAWHATRLVLDGKVLLDAAEPTTVDRAL